MKKLLLLAVTFFIPLSASPQDHDAIKALATQLDSTTRNLIYAINHYDGDDQHLSDLAYDLDMNYKSLVKLPIGNDPTGQIKQAEESMQPNVSSISQNIEFGGLVQALKSANDLHIELVNFLGIL